MEGEKKRKFQPHASSLPVEDYQKANLSQFASPHFPEIKSSSFRSSANFLKREGDLGTESLITPIFNDPTTFSFFSSSLLPETASPLFLASPVSVEVQKDPKSSGFFASLASDVTQKIQTEQKRKSEKEIDLMWFLQRKLKFERENKLKVYLMFSEIIVSLSVS